ncbi:MAG: YgjP-like metallopeptidase domain-containing protein [Acidithiobacillus sp.]
MVLPALPTGCPQILGVSLCGCRCMINPLSLRGSRNTRSHDIRLNTELAKKPPECLEYVLVHEMTHLWSRPTTSVSRC